jgi:uncharacterized membrane protein YphA (DoxX/SURF4 family)
MNSLTKFMLILLRIAIGWHLLFAGLAKFEADYKGSEGYLQNSGGPLAPTFHRMAGDRLADRLAADPDTGKPAHDRFPPALATEWNDYFEAFAAHYNLTAEQRQTAKEKIDKIKDDAVIWMTKEPVTIKKTSPYGPPAEVTKTVPEWVKEYQATRQKVREQSAGDFSYAFSLPSLADNTDPRASERKEVADIRNELTKSLDGYKKEMKESLYPLVTEEQAAKGPFNEAVKPAWTHMTQLDWIDFAVRWGLTISGACLILGLFTRTNCVIGALLLLSFYLAVPPLPGLPEAFRAEGYPYINKNIIEMLALLTLATTHSGRWAGLDAILYFLNPFRRHAPQPRLAGPRRGETSTAPQIAITDPRMPAHTPSHSNT